MARARRSYTRTWVRCSGPAFGLSALACAALTLAGLATLAWPFTVDDAFIVGRYADRLSRGLGFTFSSSLPSDGVTGPLFLLPARLGVALGFDALLSAKLSSALAALIALLWVMQQVSRRAQGRLMMVLVPLFVCSALPFVAWSVAGLETGLAALGLTAVALGSLGRPRALLAGFSAAALAWLRPELLAPALVLLLALFARDRRAGLRALAIALVGVGSVVLFRVALFGHALPMTASAKPPLLGHGARYLYESIARPRSVPLVLLLAASMRWGGRQGALLVAALAAHGCAVLLVGGDWMPARRLFVPAIPLLAWASALGAARLALRRRGLALGLVALSVATGTLELVPELGQLRRAGFRREQQGLALARVVCAARGPVAMIDIGLVGYLCPQQAFLDLGGLTEPQVAYAPGAHLHKRLSEAWLSARAPGLIVLHSRERPRVDDAGRVRWFAGYPVERALLGMPYVQAHYRAREVIAYAPSYYYLVLAPR